MHPLPNMLIRSINASDRHPAAAMLAARHLSILSLRWSAPMLDRDPIIASMLDRAPILLALALVLTSQSPHRRPPIAPPPALTAGSSPTAPQPTPVPIPPAPDRRTGLDAKSYQASKLPIKTHRGGD